MKFTIALAQIDPVPGNLRHNLGLHARAIAAARDGGADLVVFPELSLTGYMVKDAAWDLAVADEGRIALAGLAEECRGIAAIAGGIEESARHGLYNAAFLVGGEGVRVVHRKVYLPTYGMFEEGRYFLRGERAAAFTLPFARAGALICEDLWHLPLPWLLAQDGAEVILALSASPTRLSGPGPDLRVERVNGEQHRALARLLSVYVCFCNRVGFEDGVNFWGGSSVVSPSGETAARAALFAEELLFAEIDLEAVRQARKAARHFLDDDPHFTMRELQRILGNQTKG
jgi:predicted amidohydrolase